ncbi:hypothetical protein PQD76_gp84 [Stenotrophomonas phage BUCT626]|uniref:Uncharacterized protein n=1 Tax=Stenotrophomonas phage BUCT626 TaxID=2860376 RepID=A0AC61NLC4_9CAUD|nr:hypothetical protein PQD76_gp84 [Stenotrophomonas phage BUCT626]QYC96789.1 hypothetical protein [Stenotrophomonas phage BUCT626]
MSQFTIAPVAIPQKSVSIAPRDSQYPVNEIIAAGLGNGFAVELRDKDGNVPEGDALKKLTSQKQSQFSQLAATRGVTFTTRALDEASAAAFGVTLPALGVWYTKAERAEKKTKAVPAVPAAPEADAGVPEVPSL